MPNPQTAAWIAAQLLRAPVLTPSRRRKVVFLLKPTTLGDIRTHDSTGAFTQGRISA